MGASGGFWARLRRVFVCRVERAPDREPVGWYGERPAADRDLSRFVWLLTTERPSLAVERAGVARELAEIPAAAVLRLEHERVDVDHRRLDRIRALPDDERVPWTCLATLASNGYVREAAIADLADVDPGARGFVGGWLLLRTHDWVEPVGRAAAEALARFLSRCRDETLAELAGLLPWLARRHRGGVARAFDAIRHELLAPARRAMVVRLRGSPRAAEREIAWRAAMDEVASDEQAFVTVLRDDSPKVARLAAETLCGAAPDPGRVRLLFDVASAQVLAWWLPRVAADALVDHVERLLVLATGPDRMLRRRAQSAAQRAGLDLHDPVRRLVEARSAARGAVAALGELGGQPDVPLLRSVFEDRARNPSVRAAAALAMQDLDADTFAPEAVVALLAEEPPLRRAGRRMLRRIDRWRWAPAARDLLHGDDGDVHAAVYRTLLDRAVTHSLEVVPDLVRAACEAEPSVARRAVDLLDAWQRRHGAKGWLRPDDRTRAALLDVAERHCACATARQAEPCLPHRWAKRASRA